MTSLEHERAELRRRCSHRLSGHGPENPADLLARVARWIATHGYDEFDHYGQGAIIADFEGRVAEHLGYQAGRFMPSGTLAQQIALRVWAERAHCNTVGMHPTSHLELHEQHGYRHLHGLDAILVGPADSPMTAGDLEAVDSPLAALLTELPVREAAGSLPSWSELAALKAAARARRIPLHLDGARLWECAAPYQRTHAEICRGFDSCYVSFYKGIGALSGSMLLGSSEFLEEAAIWQRRCGGNLYTLLPNVASAAMLFDDRLARMPAYYQRALEIADVLGSLDDVGIIPERPHTNMMHLEIHREAESALSGRDRAARETGVWLFHAVRPGTTPEVSTVEIYVGEGACQLSDDELLRAFQLVVDPTGW